MIAIVVSLLAVSVVGELQVGDWQAPGPDDIRGPCPGLNTLANYGYINRNGKDITADSVSKAMREAFGFGNSINYFQVVGATVNGREGFHDFGFGIKKLSDLGTHNQLEHDASFSRDDYFFHHDPNTRNDTLVDQLVSFSRDGKTLTRDDLALARAARINDSLARNPEHDFQNKFQNALYREMSLLSLLLGEPLKTNYVTYFFKNEKLPVELGWRKREAKDLTDLGLHLQQKADFEKRVKAIVAI